MKYKAVLFSPDGEDWVTDYESDTVEGVWSKMDNGGSRWFFYPIGLVIRSHGSRTTSRQRVVADGAPAEMEDFAGLSIATIGRWLASHPAEVAAWLS
jgi:hypothetical protein